MTRSVAAKTCDNSGSREDATPWDEANNVNPKTCQALRRIEKDREGWKRIEKDGKGLRRIEKD